MHHVHTYTQVYHICIYNVHIHACYVYIHVHIMEAGRPKICDVRHFETPWDPGQLVVQLHSGDRQLSRT